MWWHTLTILLLGILLPLACLTASIILLVRALRGRYVGEEPRCKSCTYQLTGRLDAERCPECGTKLSTDTIVHGLHRPNWWALIAAGLVIAVFWGLSREFFWNVPYSVWYHYYPTKLVVRDASTDSLDGINELIDRVSIRSLSRSKLDAVFELALRKHEQTPPVRHRFMWSLLLGRLDCHRLLTDEQRDLLFQGFAQCSLTIRSVIRQGDPIVVRLDCESSRSRMRWYRFWHEPTQVLVGNKEIFQASGDDWRHRYYRPDGHLDDQFPVTGKRMVFEEAELPPGISVLEYRGRHVCLPIGVDTLKESPSWSKDVVLSGTVEILPTTAPATVTWLDDFDGETPLQDSFGVCVWMQNGSVCVPEGHPILQDTKAHLQTDGGRETLDMFVSSRAAIPVPVAFDLLIEADGVELDTEVSVEEWMASPAQQQMLASVAGRTLERSCTARVPRFTADEIFIILRASRDVARRTADIYEIWQGELRFGPFPVKHDTP